jgi:esterase/lipase superfamily enzyme
MSHFIITNRKLNEKGEAAIKKMAKTATANLRCGTINVDLKPSNAISFFPDNNETATYTSEPFNIAEYNEQWGSHIMFDRLCEALDKAAEQKNDVILFLHGFGNSFNRTFTLLKELHLNYIMRADCRAGLTITFSWPSQEVLHYNQQREDALTSGKAFARLYMKLLKYQQQKERQVRIHLFCQSMGNQVLAHALTKLTEINGAGNPIPGLFTEILLTGADVECDALETGKELGRVPEIGKRVHVYHGTDDKVLLTSSFLYNGHRGRLGLQGPRDTKVLPQNVYVVDATEVDSTGVLDIDHMLFLKHQTVIADITKVVNGLQLERSRTLPRTNH